MRNFCQGLGAAKSLWMEIFCQRQLSSTNVVVLGSALFDKIYQTAVAPLDQRCKNGSTVKFRFIFNRISLKLKRIISLSFSGSDSLKF